LLRELQLGEEVAGGCDGERGGLRDGEALARDSMGAKLNAEGFGAETRAAAGGAEGVLAEAAEEDAHVDAVLLALEQREEAFDAGEFAHARPNQLLLRGGELTPGAIEREPGGLGDTLEGVAPAQAAWRVPGLDGALGEGAVGIGHDASEADLAGAAEALAVRTSAEGIVEGEEAGLGGFETAAAALALEALIEAEGGARGRRGEFEDGFAGFAVGDLDAVHQAGAQFGGFGFEQEAVHQHKHGLVEIEVQERFRGRELDQFARLPEAIEAAGAELGQARLDAGLAAAEMGGEEQQAALAGSLGEERGDGGIHIVALDLEVAVGTVDAAGTGEEEAEVVVDFGGGGHAGAGIAAGGFLANGDGGRDALDGIHLGLFHALEELAGVGGEGLDVAALAFGVDGIEGEAALARAADAGDDGEGVERNVHAQVLEIVEARAVDAEELGGAHGALRCTSRTSSSTFPTGVSGRMPWPRLKI